MQQFLTNREVARVASSVQTLEGGGVPIRRAFPTGALDDIDPFLLLDEMGPLTVSPGKVTGFPDHPHRGFETVTYILEGQIEHRDSHGHQGVLGPGDVQWMTAGAGVVHSEMPGSEIVRKGGRLHGFQLWVNLPRQYKMIEPRYQELPASSIPVARNAGGDVKVRIIAGETFGQSGLIQTYTPILYMHFTLQSGGEHSQAVPGSYNAFAYVIEGEGVAGASKPVTEDSW